MSQWIRNLLDLADIHEFNLKVGAQIWEGILEVDASEETIRILQLCINDRLMAMYKITVTKLEVDPTPWCSSCGAKKASQCDCGPRAEND